MPSPRLLPIALLLTIPTVSPVHAEPEALSLANGDQITGEVISRNDREIVVEHAALGRVTLPTEALAPEPGEKPGLFGTQFMQGWNRSLGIGLTGSEGNTDESDLRIAFHLNTDTPDTRWKIDGAYKLSISERERDDQFGSLLSRHDWLVEDSRWFAFTGAQYHYDEFEDWEHRLSAFAGPGYHIVEGEKMTLNGMFGLSATYEFGDKEQLRPEAMLGFELSWEPSEAQTLSLSNALFQQLDASEFRNRTRAQWKLRIMDSEHLSLGLGIDNEYDSDADDERNNLKYWTSLDYNF
jgi:hypothetical protein